MPSLAALALVVHVSNLAGVPPAVLRDAQTEARRLFAEVGVDVRFEDEEPQSTEVAARLILVAHANGSLRDSFVKVMGAASRDTAWVFVERVREKSDRNAVSFTQLLACAIAHEIGHVMRVVPEHSDRGLMRANWGPSEYRNAALGALRFNARN